MKKNIFFLAFCFCVMIAKSQSVAINTDGSTANGSALLDIKSTTKGMLAPRMTSVQRSAISSPAKGLMVFDNDTNSFWFYNGSAWTELNTGGGGTNYWATDGSNIYNNNIGKVWIGTNSGAGFLTIKEGLNIAPFLLLSETGDLSGDYLGSWLSTGGGTATTRFGLIDGHFGNGFGISNTSPVGPIIFSTNTSEKMRITSAGLLGINTVTPTSQLEVNTSTGIAGITHTNGTVRLSTFVSTLGGELGTTTNHALHFFTNNSGPLMSISTAGNVGIGVPTASTKLEITTNDAQWGMTHDNGTISIGTYVGSGGGWLGTKSNNPLYFCTSLGNTNNISQMTLLTSGNLGIGTNTPATKLEVFNSSGYGIVHTNGIVSIGTYISSGAGWIGTRSNHPLYFFANDGTASMTVMPGGNVGIGTTAPAYKLSVSGTIQSKEVRVETGWADFVFDETYNLQPLPEVEKFIQVNKHLQGIPSAKEIQDNGLALGEVQTKMMQKIEELTLYVIELQKQITELKNDKK